MGTKTYIMLDDEYFEVFPFSIGEFTKALYPGEMFSRYSWPETVFKNEPKKYRNTLNDAYRLYDLVKAKKYSEDIKIKHIWTDGINTITIEGIFRSYMCAYEDDDEHKTFKITPITLDQYTYFLENWEKDIDILTGGAKNKVINGDFKTWDSTAPISPVGWTVNPGFAHIYRKFDKIYAKLDIYNTSNSYLTQSFSVNANQNIQVMFDYALTYESTEYLNIRSSRKIFISLFTGTINYYLNLDPSGSYVWNTDNSGIAFKQPMVALRVDYLTEMKHFECISETVPAAGALTISFDLGNNGVNPEAPLHLILGDVRLYANTTEYESITIDVPLTGLEEQKIFNSTCPLDCKPTTADFEAAQPDWSDDPLYCFFNADASYNMDMGTDVGFELMNNLFKLNDIKLGSLSRIITDVFQAPSPDPNDELLKHYKLELSDITIYQCPKYKWWNGGTLISLLFNEYTKFLATCTFSRQVAYTFDDENGDAVYPSGGDTVWYDTALRDKANRRKFIRTPQNGTAEWEFYNGTTTSSGINETAGKINGWDYIRSLSSRRKYTASSTVTYTTGIDLKKMFEMLFRSTHASYALKNVYSTFFWNDNESDMPTIFNGSNTGINYVSMDRNFLNNITCLHTTEFNTSIDESSADNELKFSPKSFLDDIKKYFNIYDLGGVYWWIDADYNFHIEHIKYFDIKALKHDIRNYVNRPMKNWKPSSEVLYSIISFDQVNSGLSDFHENSMTFDIPTMLATQEKKRTNKTTILTTDLRYCYENPTNLTNGLVLINHDGSPTNKKAISSEVRMTKMNEANGNLSLSTILNLFCRYEGILMSGKINDENVVFENTVRSTEGNEITAKVIIEGEVFSTEIEENGLAKSITHNFNDQTTKATLVYKPTFVLKIESSDDFVGAVDKFLDLGFHL